MVNSQFYLKNLKLIRPYLEKNAYQALTNYTPQHTTLCEPHSGSVVASNIKIQDNYIYPKDALTYTQEQVVKYQQNPKRLLFDNRLGHNTEHYAFYPRNTGEYILKAICQHGYKLSDKMQNTEIKVGYGISFGLGLGLHLSDFVKNNSFINLIICDASLDFLYCALSTINWRDIISPLEERGGRVHFLFNDDAQLLNLALTTLMQKERPSIIEGSYFYIHHRHGVVSELINRFQESFKQIISYNGWLEDEFVHLQNISNNILRNSAAAFINRELDFSLNAPVIIVGSGPSLEAELEHLKHIAPKVIIISAGTSLRILLKAGIKPDFHCELENTKTVIDVLNETSKEYDFSGITLLASFTTTPKIADFFESTIYLPREGDAIPSLMKGPYQSIPFSGRTATLTALAIALYWKAQYIFLLGLDFAKTFDGLSHSANSIYELDSEKYGKGSANDTDEILVPGNFRAQVISSRLWTFMRQGVELAISTSNKGNSQIYNLCDGAKILGASPFRLTNLITEMQQMPVKEQIAIKIHMFYSFPCIADLKGQVNWHSAIAEAEDVFDDFVKILNHKSKAVAGKSEALSKLIDRLAGGNNPTSPNYAAAALSGSLLRPYHWLHFKLLRNNTRENQSTFVEITNEVLMLSCYSVLNYLGMIIHIAEKFGYHVKHQEILTDHPEWQSILNFWYNLYKNPVDAVAILRETNITTEAQNLIQRTLQIQIDKPEIIQKYGNTNPILDTLLTPAQIASPIAISNCAICNETDLIFTAREPESEQYFIALCNSCGHEFYNPSQSDTYFFHSHIFKDHATSAPCKEHEKLKPFKWSLIEKAINQENNSITKNILEIHPEDISLSELEMENINVSFMPINDDDIHYLKNIDTKIIPPLPYFVGETSYNPDEKFDLILLQYSLEKSSTPIELLRQANQLLDKNGKIIGIVSADRVLRHIGLKIHEFSMISLRKLLEYNFKNIEISLLEAHHEIAPLNEPFHSKQILPEDLYFSAEKK